MPYLIGACCADQIVDGGSGSGSFGVINELIQFTNLSELVVPWNGTRIAKYGPTGDFMVMIIQDDGKARPVFVEIIPNDVNNPTSYHFDFGGVSSGTITIS